MPKLLTLPPAPVIRLDGDRVRLDVKFLEGMAFICANWPGTVDCVLREIVGPITFGVETDIAALPFGLKVIPADASVPKEMLAGYDLIEASADMHLDLDLCDPAKNSPAKRVFVIEYTLRTRLEIVWLDRTLSPARKARSAVWQLQQERRRRRAMSAADGVMMNGFPAFQTYRKLNPRSLMYLDNRMHEQMFATPDQIEQRMAALRGGGPLRLINSGRLEPMKGSQDLVPIARMLAERGVNFTLDIYGTGSLEAEVRAGINAAGLQDRVRLHAPVDFETELVPISRTQADLFLSCHRQSDPSCTYIEAMGCGLPVVGYANDMLAALAKTSGTGWVVRRGDTAALADKIASIATEPERMADGSIQALSFAKQNGFAAEFSKRRKHMLDLVGWPQSEARSA